jgi:hypothetical protein
MAQAPIGRRRPLPHAMLPVHPPADPLDRRPPPGAARGARLRRWLASVAAGLLLAAGAVTANADTIALRAAELQAGEDGYVLNAEFDVTINPTLEEALQKGLPLYFVLEFELLRSRWYWLDEKVVVNSTVYRVAWDALTRNYRVSSGLLRLNFNTIDEVQRFLSRVTGRQVARRDQLAPGARYEAAVRLMLDVNQLPKPFQVNALTSREWTLQSDWHRWSYTP